MALLDAVVIGAGHNGLACAAYLGKAGLSVRVLERRDVVGGAAITEEFHPGFRNSVAAYAVSLLQPKVIADLELHRHGLKIVERRAQNFLPTEDGRYLLTGEGRTLSEIAKFSTDDAARYPAYAAEIQRVAAVLRDLVLEAPPNMVGGAAWRTPAELFKLVMLGNRLRRLDAQTRRALLDLFTKSAGDYLDFWFASDPVKALFGFDSIVGNFASPYTPGTAYVLLHHAFGEVNGKTGTWGHAIGGMGAISAALAQAAIAHGVRIDTRAAVQEIVVERGRACGVVLSDGSLVRARAVIANVNPKFLFESLVPRDALPAWVADRMRRWKNGSGTFRMNVALSALPNFSALPNSSMSPGREIGDHHTAGIILGPSLRYMDRAFHDACIDGWSKAPIIEVVIPSTLDDSLAPKGAQGNAHVASLFCQHAAPQLPDGASWDDKREQVADLMIDTVEKFAPGFRASVVGRQVFSPLDLERVFGLPNGDIFHGALTLDQLFSARPMLGHADYRMPLPGLYLCGSGAHPGGGVTGAPGHNAARAVIRDLRGVFAGWFRRA
jgi:phytoene dehydrogenase-like protein